MDYEDFREVVRTAAEGRLLQGRLVPLPELRRACPALDRATFDTYLLRLNREGVVHLLSHVEPDKLPEDVRGECLLPEKGPLLYWVRWV